MKNLSKILLLAVLALAPVQNLRAQAWVTYRPPDGHYEVKFPGQPKERTNSAAAGAVQVNVASFSSPSKVLMVSSSGFANDCAVKTIDINKLLDNARDGVLKSFNGQIKSEKKYPPNGRELAFQGQGFQALQRSVFNSTSCRLYQVMAITPQDPMADPDAAIFFSSFKILK